MEKPPSSSAENSALEMDIISNTYRSIIDQNAFDQLMDNWKTRLDRLDAKGADQSGFSFAFLQQLNVAQKTLEELDIQPDDGKLERVVSEVAGPAVVFAPDLRVTAINIDGTRAFGAEGGTIFDMSLIDAASIGDFEALIRSANGRGNLDQAIITVAPPGRVPFHAEAFLVRLTKTTRPYIALRTLEIGWSKATSEKLRQAFGLSATEADVARLFFKTCNLQEVAALRQASLHTVRTQMKTIQSKTGASSQADLIRLCSMVASRELLGGRSELSEWHDPLGRESYLDLDDGRRIAWTWMGAKDGMPAVVLRGLGMGYLLPARTEMQLIEAGIKLYIPSHPGYGNSSMHQNRMSLRTTSSRFARFSTPSCRSPA